MRRTGLLPGSVSGILLLQTALVSTALSSHLTAECFNSCPVRKGDVSELLVHPGPEQTLSQLLSTLNRDQKPAVITDIPSRPMLLRKGSLKTAWNALKFGVDKHSPSLDQVLPVKTVSKSTGLPNEFEFYESGLPLVDLINDWRAPNNESDFSVYDYLRYIADDQSEHWMHLSYELGTESELIQPFGFNWTDSVPNAKDTSVREWIHSQLIPEGNSFGTAKIWISANQASTRLHFDVSANVNTQLTGSKLFRLMSPACHWCVSPFPWLNPRSRKAQCIREPSDVDDSCESSQQESECSAQWSPIRDECAVFDVTLQSGQTLFIPPMWFHEVVSLSQWTGEKDTQSLDVNLNLWTETPVSNVQQSLLEHPLPLSDDWSEHYDRTVHEIRVFVQYLFKHLIGDGEHPRFLDQRTYVSQYRESRYGPMFSEKKCDTRVKSGKQRQFTRICNKMQQICDAQSPPKVKNIHKFDQYAGDIVRKVFYDDRIFTPITPDQNAMLAASLRSEREIYLGAYMEIVIQYVLGTPSVYPFLLFCLDF